MSGRRITNVELAKIYSVSPAFLTEISQEGWNVLDARRVVERIITASKKIPAAWIETKDKITKVSDDDSHENLRRLKTKGEVERLDLANAKASGAMFDRKDGDAVMAAWSSALVLALTEMAATLPPQLEGLGAASVELALQDAFDGMRNNLSNLASELWQKTFASYVSELEEDEVLAEAKQIVKKKRLSKAK